MYFLMALNSILFSLCPVYENSDVFLFSSQAQSMASVTVTVIPQMTHIVQKVSQQHINKIMDSLLLCYSEHGYLRYCAVP